MVAINEESDFESALRLCQGRAESAFGDSRVFIEEYVTSAEHIEFQVVADGSKAIHLGERFLFHSEETSEDSGRRTLAKPVEREEIGSKGCCWC